MRLTKRALNRTLDIMGLRQALAEALELGATRCLRKPFTSVALMTVINECLAGSQHAAIAQQLS